MKARKIAYIIALIAVELLSQGNADASGVNEVTPDNVIISKADYKNLLQDQMRLGMVESGEIAVISEETKNIYTDRNVALAEERDLAYKEIEMLQSKYDDLYAQHQKTLDDKAFHFRLGAMLESTEGESLDIKPWLIASISRKKLQVIVGANYSLRKQSPAGAIGIFYRLF